MIPIGAAAPDLQGERSLATTTDYQRARLLVAAVQELSTARSVEQIRAIVRAAARRVADADGATFVLRDGDHCHYVDEDAIAPLWKGQRFPIELCVSGQAMLTGAPIVIPDITLDARIPQEAYRPTFVRSLVMVPIRQADPIGAIGAYWATHHDATPEEVELLQALADSTAVALENARSIEALEQSRLETLQRLALAGEFRDDDTFHHTQRVAHTAAMIASQLGLPAREVALIRQSAALHDIGKLAVPDAILLKPGRLTRDEFEQVMGHAEAGWRILDGSRSAALTLAAEIALTHHERWDGSGYPHGKGRDEIPLSGRVVAVADVFDSLTHERPYKSAWSVGAAVAEIDGLRGKQFDPDVVDAFHALNPGNLVNGPDTGTGAAAAVRLL